MIQPAGPQASLHPSPQNACVQVWITHSFGQTNMQNAYSTYSASRLYYCFADPDLDGSNGLTVVLHLHLDGLFACTLLCTT